jgi:adenosine deaminase
MPLINIDPDLPLVDLHRHLEGSMRLETILELGQAHGVALPAETLAELRPHVQATAPQPGLMAFIEKIDLSVRVLTDPDACRRIAHECVEDAYREGIDYIEVRFSPRYMAASHNLNPADVVAAVADGVEAGTRDFDIGANLIGILSRTYGIEACWEEFEALAAHHAHITALDIAGDEAAWPAELFADHFRRGRELGWAITAHAGEAAGPRSIWTAIDRLGATRIGHGLHAIEDPGLMDAMAERGIGVEVSLTSNVQISAVPDYADHPITTYVDRGLKVTLNTDDPAVSHITLPHEYRVAAPAAGLNATQIRRIQQNGLEVAFLSHQAREAIAAKKRGASRDEEKLTSKR